MSVPAARVRVKICGVTNETDAFDAIAAGADALGFNLFPDSKRCVELDREAAWIQALPPFVTRVAVLVNVPLEEARRVAEHPAIDLVQFHGFEDELYCAAFAQFGRPFLKALRLRDEAAIATAGRFSTPHVLLDADAGGAFGGTGTLIDLALAAECVRRHPALKIVLAGGLRPANVADAVRAVRPYAVDVASGVESAPGRKDRREMAAFVEAVTAAG
jgi:phosphoribosylanthranilate isomerase